jgi:hypothetical protein
VAAAALAFRCFALTQRSPYSAAIATKAPDAPGATPSALRPMVPLQEHEDQQSDLLDLARAWRDLTDVWEAPADTESSAPSRSRRAI